MISKLTLQQSELVFFAILFKRHKSRSTDYIKGSSKVYPKSQGTVHPFISTYDEALS